MVSKSTEKYIKELKNIMICIRKTSNLNKQKNASKHKKAN